MIRHVILCMGGLYLAVVLMTTGALPAAALEVQAVRGAPSADKTRMVLELDAVADFRASVVDGPPRLVVELPDAKIRDRAGKGLARLGVTDMRVMRAGSRVRLDFMLAGPVKIAQAFMLPRDGGKPDRLVIDYKSASRADFAAAAAQSFGTLSARGGDTSGFLGVLTRLQGEGAPGEQAQSNGHQENVTSDDPPPSPLRLQRYTVVIDAGHGGKDPGAIGRDGTKEKDITFAAAKELARQLSQSNRYKVVMTRNKDEFILLPGRVKIARAVEADLFVSLHADMAVENAQASGLSIYTLSDKASDAQTEKLAASENKVDLLAGIDLSHEQEDVANILIDLAMRENMNQSRFFAGKVVSTMDRGGIDLLERPHRYAGFAVLKAPDIPSVLVEMGFLSNPVEARRLKTPDYRRKLMAGLKDGIDTYFSYLEKNRSD